MKHKSLCTFGSHLSSRCAVVQSEMDEDIDEIPVNINLLTDGPGPFVLEVEDPLANIKEGDAARDPLQAQSCVSVATIKEEDPLATLWLPKQGRLRDGNKGAQVIVKTSLARRGRGRVSRGRNHSVSPQVVQLPETPRPNLPPKYVTMSFGEFTQEMRKNMHGIVQESLGLFQRDPREYHPFYLRILKYVTIGQRLGFVSNEEDVVINSIFGGFLNLAKIKYEASIHKPVVYAGERSPYATYILTGKVVIDGKVVTTQQDEKMRKTKFKKLEDVARQIKTEWEVRNPGASEADIKDDVRTMYKFFQECKAFLDPSDTIKMNIIWSEFSGAKKTCDVKSVLPRLGGIERSTSKKNLTIKVLVHPPAQSPSRLASPLSPEHSPPPSPVSPGGPPSPASPDPPAPNTTSTSSNRKQKLAPRSISTYNLNLSTEQTNSTTNSGISTLSLKAKSGKKRRKDIPKKAAKQPIHAKSILLKTKRKLRGRKMWGDSQQLQLERLITTQPGSKVKAAVISKNTRVLATPRKKSSNTSIQKLTPLNDSCAKVSSSRKNVNKLSKFRKTASNSGMTSKTTKTSFSTKSSLRRKKRQEALSRLRNSGKNSDARQLRLEKLSIRRKTSLKNSNEISTQKANSAQKKDGEYIKIEINDDITDAGTNHFQNENCDSSDEAECTSKIIPPQQQQQQVARQIPKRRSYYCDICGKRFFTVNEAKLWEHKVKDHDGSPEEVAAALGVSSVVKCDFCPKWFFKQIILLRHLQSDHPEHFKIDSLKKQQRMDTFNIHNKYIFSRLIVNCELCGVKLRLSMLSYHLKTGHRLIENGNLWHCKICPAEIKFTSRYLWLRHMKTHRKQVNMDEILEIAKKPNTSNTSVPETTADVPAVRLTPSESSLYSTHCASKIRQQQQEEDPMLHESLIDPEGREKCEGCNGLFDPAYLPIHKEAFHSLISPRVACPACAMTFISGIGVWNHYCTEHISNGDFSYLDPVPPSFRSGYKVPVKNDDSIVPSKISRFCDKCGREFCSVDSLRRHLSNFHGGEDQQPRDYFQCAYCPKQYKNKDILDEHVRRIHQGLVISTCPHCTRDLQSSGKLWKHMIVAHGISATDAAAHCKVAIITCSLCGEDLLADRQYVNHVKTQHPEQSTEFLNACKNQAKAIRPFRSRDRIKPEGGYKVKYSQDSGVCPECGKKTKQGLRSHRLKVHGVDLEVGFDCPLDGCKSRLTTLSNVRKHIRAFHISPLEEKIVSRKIIEVVEEGTICSVYLCTLCNTYLFYYDQIKVHMVASHPEFCEDIGKPLEFLCPHCSPLAESNKWDSEEMVRKHVEEVHPELMWRCPICDKSVLSPEDLDKHFMEDHSNNNKSTVEGGGGKTVKDRDDEENKLYLKLKCVPKDITHKIASETTQLLKARKELFHKYSEMTTKCEICKTEVPLKCLGTHALEEHGIQEDGEPFQCNLCFRETAYSLERRTKYLYHMHQYHGNQVNMDELIREASKFRFRDHWSKLQKESNTSTQPSKLKEGSRKNTRTHEHMRRKNNSRITKCEICETDVPLNRLGTHVVEVHGIKEDEPFECNLCPEKREFKRRTPWLSHMLACHGQQVNMEELIEEASKLRLKVHWSKLVKRRKSTRTLKRSKLNQKYFDMMTKCEICEQEVELRRLGTHFSYAHGMKEDGQPFQCYLCPQKKEYTIKNRTAWLLHMHKRHGQRVNMDKLVEEAKKLRTKENCSKMDLKENQLGDKNIERNTKDDDGIDASDTEESDFEASNSDDESEKNVNSKEAAKKSSRRKKVDRSSLKRKASGRGAKNYKKLAGEDSEEDTSSDEDAEINLDYEEAVVRNKKPLPATVPPPPPLRVSARTRKPVKKYYSDDENVEDDDLDLSKNNGATSSRFKSLSGGGGGYKGPSKKETLNPSFNSTTNILLKNVEGNKRLVIQVARLTKEQLLKHVRIQTVINETPVDDENIEDGNANEHYNNDIKFQDELSL